eukprot:scaffold7779_cov62-Phaeocystis_antarctica.AAC.9
MRAPVHCASGDFCRPPTIGWYHICDCSIRFCSARASFSLVGHRERALSGEGPKVPHASTTPNSGLASG